MTITLYFCYLPFHTLVKRLGILTINCYTVTGIYKLVRKQARDQSGLLQLLKSYKLAEEPGLLNNEPVDLSDIPLAAEDNMCAEAH